MRTPKRYEDFVTFEALSINPQNKSQDPILVFKATADPDTMYYHEAMREPDADQFKRAMQEEIDSCTKNKTWKIFKSVELPTGSRVLPAVWAMKSKRRIATQEVYKWKARLNIDGSKQKY